VLAGAPQPRKCEVVVGVDDRRDCIVDPVFGDVPLINPGDLSTIRSLDGSRRLARTKVAAIAEGREQVAFSGMLELGFKPG
jgi:hypothetical protein